MLNLCHSEYKVQVFWFGLILTPLDLKGLGWKGLSPWAGAGLISLHFWCWTWAFQNVPSPFCWVWWQDGEGWTAGGWPFLRIPAKRKLVLWKQSLSAWKCRPVGWGEGLVSEAFAYKLKNLSSIPRIYTKKPGSIVISVTKPATLTAWSSTKGCPSVLGVDKGQRDHLQAPDKSVLKICLQSSRR